MAKIDATFNDIVKTILKEGRLYEDTSRDTQRLQIPSYTLRHDFRDGFPAITIKKLAWKSVVGELIWFLRGDNNVAFLQENKIPIWDDDAKNWEEKTGEIGSVGRNYSKQWREYANEVDQIVNLIRDMKQNIMSTRLKVEAWNPAEIKKTALPPCHTGFQIIGVPLSEQEQIERNFDPEDWLEICSMDCEMEALESVPKFGFELHWNQRSVDTFLGLPFNIASYALLAKILEQLTGYPVLAIQGDLKCVHLYQNAFRKSEDLLTKDVTKHNNELGKFCELAITKPIFLKQNKSFDEMINEAEIKDFLLDKYESEKYSSVKMLAPKTI